MCGMCGVVCDVWYVCVWCMGRVSVCVWCVGCMSVCGVCVVCVLYEVCGYGVYV